MHTPEERKAMLANIDADELRKALDSQSYKFGGPLPLRPPAMTPEEIKAMIEAEVSRQLEARFAGARAYVESVRHTFDEVAVHRSIVSNRPDHEPKEAA